jgi:hypothetical protein
MALLALLATVARVADVQIDVIHPLPGSILPLGDAFVTIDLAFDGEIAEPHALRACIELDLHSRSCFPVTSGGRPKLRDLQRGKHTIAVSLKNENNQTIGEAGPVTFFVEDYATVNQEIGSRFGDDLDRMAVGFGTDKGSFGHFYTRFYPTYLEHRRADKLRVLEIGCKDGNSLWLWQVRIEMPRICSGHSATN